MINDLQEVFKTITEAYTVLSNAEKRRRYDSLLFGQSAGATKDFSNQDAYEYWSQRKQQSESAEAEDDRSEKMEEILKK